MFGESNMVPCVTSFIACFVKNSITLNVSIFSNFSVMKLNNSLIKAPNQPLLSCMESNVASDQAI